LFSADKPDRLRGPQFHWAIADELAAWRFMEAWDMLMFCLRLGDNPQVAVATTPRPIPILKEMIEDPMVAKTIGTTYENKENLAEVFFSKITKKYEGTRLGRQELNAELLMDTPGALWKLGKKGEFGTIENGRVAQVPALKRIVVGVDPPGSNTTECGIIVAGLGVDDKGYALQDRSLNGSPGEWGYAVVKAYLDWEADLIVAEKNFGGDMVEHTIRTIRDKDDKPIGKNLPVGLVHASRGKYIRAEPISALYEQERCHHHGSFSSLEDEMTTFVPGNESPNRLDALVWALTELMIEPEEPETAVPAGIEKPSKFR